MSDSFEEIYLEVLVTKETSLLSLPRCIRSTTDSNLLVCSWDDRCVVKLDLMKGLDYSCEAIGMRYKAGEIDSHNLLRNPSGMAVSQIHEGIVYISDWGSRTIQRCNMNAGSNLERIIGTGRPANGDLGIHSGIFFPLSNPWWVSMNLSETLMAVTDRDKGQVHIFEMTSGNFERISTVTVEDQLANAVEFFDSDDVIYISTKTGIVSSKLSLDHGHRQDSEAQVLVCGNLNGEKGFRDGLRFDALFWGIYGFIMNQNHDQIFLADVVNNRIRMLDCQTQTVSTIAGDGQSHLSSGPAMKASINAPFGICWDAKGGIAVVSRDSNAVSIIRGVNDSPRSSLSNLVSKIWIICD